MRLIWYSGSVVGRDVGENPLNYHGTGTQRFFRRVTVFWIIHLESRMMGALVFR